MMWYINLRTDTWKVCIDDSGMYLEISAIVIADIYHDLVLRQYRIGIFKQINGCV